MGTEIAPRQPSDDAGGDDAGGGKETRAPAHVEGASGNSHWARYVEALASGCHKGESMARSELTPRELSTMRQYPTAALAEREAILAAGMGSTEAYQELARSLLSRSTLAAARHLVDSMTDPGATSSQIRATEAVLDRGGVVGAPRGPASGAVVTFNTLVAPTMEQIREWFRGPGVDSLPETLDGS